MAKTKLFGDTSHLDAALQELRVETEALHYERAAMALLRERVGDCSNVVEFVRSAPRYDH